MNWIDFTIAAFICCSVIIGINRGFIKELLSCIIWGFTYFFILNYYDNFAKLLFFINNDLARNITSFTILLSFSLIINTILNNLFNKLILKLNLSISDKLLGSIFGFLRGVIFITIILLFIEKFTKFSEFLDWKQSKLIPIIFNIITNYFHWLKTTYNFSFNLNEILISILT